MRTYRVDQDVETLHSPDDFIAFFQGIPDEKWTTGRYEFEGACCALGHCGLVDRCDSLAHSLNGTRLNVLLGDKTIRINDGQHSGYQQLTPKERVISALRDARDGKRFDWLKQQAKEWQEKEAAKVVK